MRREKTQRGHSGDHREGETERSPQNRLLFIVSFAAIMLCNKQSQNLVAYNRHLFVLTGTQSGQSGKCRGLGSGLFSVIPHSPWTSCIWGVFFSWPMAGLQEAKFNYETAYIISPSFALAKAGHMAMCKVSRVGKYTCLS